jgi:hypothetical protein
MKNSELNSSRPAVAIFIYKRPELVKGLIHSISGYQPRKLYIVADGPKVDSINDESQLCEEARRKAEDGINWVCEIKKIYALTNMGLRDRMQSGLDQVFSKETEAILLEEDCHPMPDFFPFCQEMLQRYRHDERVGGISGSCFLRKKIDLQSDYYFSRYLHIWGWGTWARAWQAYRSEQWTWPDGGFEHYFPNSSKAETDYWNKIYGCFKSGELETWDYPWMSYLWGKNMASITPAENLVLNSGFGPEATNTKDKSMEAHIERKGRLLPPYHEPEGCETNSTYDQETFRDHFLRSRGKIGFWQRFNRSISRRLRFPLKSKAV